MKPTVSNFRPAALVCLFVLAAAFTTTARAGDPETAFLNPPDSAKPLVYWFWMGRNITAEGITGDLEALKAAGFGGTTMCNLGDCCTPWPFEIGHGLNPDMVPYVSESWWKLVRHAAAESRRLGLDFGMHNCPGYESNGGPWITPELSMQEICFTQTAVTGPQGREKPPSLALRAPMVNPGKQHIALPRPTVDPRANMPFPVYNADKGLVERPEVPARKTYYRDIAVLALPAEGVVPKEKVVDLSQRMAADGTLDWEVPAGKWIIYRFGHTTMGTLIQPTIWKAAGLECDKMNTEAVAFHMDHVIAEIRKHLGDLTGHGLNYIWFDSYEAGTPNWTPKMREEFQTRRGYDLTPFLPTWAQREIGSAAESRKFHEDFQRTIFDLYRDVNFGVSSQKAHAAGLRIQCEPYVGPWNIAEVVPKFDQVAGEFWNQGNRYSPLCVNEVVAAAHLAGQNLVTAEAFTAPPDMSLWNETPEWLKPLGDAAYCDGINRLMLHRFTHEPWNDRYKPGVVMGQWGTHFDRTQTWWEPGKAWVQYMQRCQALLQWGRFAAAPGDFGATTRGGARIKSIHRTDGASDVFFVANLARVPGAAKCSFAVAGKQPELWDPVTAAMRDLPEFDVQEGRTIVPLRFESGRSFFIVFRKRLPLPAGKAAGVEGKLFPSPTGKEAGGEGKNLPSPTGRGAGGEGKNLPSPSGRGAGGEGGLQSEKSDTVGATPLTLSQRERGPAKNFPKLSPIAELSGPWQVAFDPKWGGPEKPVTFAALEDWTKRPEPGIKYFSGTAVYRKTFDLPQAKLAARLELDLGAVRHLARVNLNGKDLGVVWCAPWSVPIPDGVLKAAGNRLVVELTNVWANRLIGDEQEPPDCQWLPGHMGHGGFLKEFPEWFVKGQPRPSQGRYCFTTWNYFTKDSPLIPSGLLGPVHLMEEDWTQAPEDFPPRSLDAGRGLSPRKSPLAITVWEDDESSAAFECDVARRGLVPVAKRVEDRPAHDGGGTNADAIANGTTLNGSGGDETENDGKTFRGYAEGSALTFQLDLAAGPAGYDLTKIQTFAGHFDGRASQNYSVWISHVSTPARFEKLAHVAVRYAGRSTEVRIEPRKGKLLGNGLGCRASGVAAVRFEFHDGPLGFNVYREIQVLGTASGDAAKRAEPPRKL